MTCSQFKDYENHLKTIYFRSKLRNRYTDYIMDLFKQNTLDREILNGLIAKDDWSFPIALCRKGLYPKHLLYTKEEDSKVFLPELSDVPVPLFKRLIKKELLRKIFLFQLDKFLSKHPYNVDFMAYRYIPTNSIQFTLEYQYSSNLYNDFFELK